MLMRSVHFEKPDVTEYLSGFICSTIIPFVMQVLGWVTDQATGNFIGSVFEDDVHDV